MTSAERRWSSSSSRSDTTKFPDFDQSIAFREHQTIYEEDDTNTSQEGKRALSPYAWSRANGGSHNERLVQRKESNHSWGNAYANGAARGHIRQKSLGDAFRTIRTRQASVSQNAQEIADALKAPVSYKLVVCVLNCWNRCSLL